MKIARDSENWMRCRVENQIKRKYPIVPDSINRSKQQQKLDWLFDGKQWYIGIFITIAFFGILTLLLNLFGAGILPDPHDQKGLDFGKFVDDRCSNLATISSMSLAVIAFLLSNIAIKEPYAVKLLFKRTKLSFVVIFALTSLAIFIFTSAYRFIFKPAYFYENVALATALTFVAVLALIGYLFIEIIVYIDPARIDTFINLELQKDALKIIYGGLLVKVSSESYEMVMHQSNVPPFSLGGYFSGDSLRAAMRLLDPNAPGTPKPAKPQKSYVIDLNLAELRNYLQSKKGIGLTYQQLYLGLETDITDNFVSVPGKENSKDDKQQLKKMLVKAETYPSVGAAQEIRKHHEEKLITLAEAGKHKELERILQGLESLYNFQLEFQLPKRYDVSSGLPGRLNEAIRSAIKNQHFRCFYLLVQFCMQTSVRAVLKDNHEIYRDLLFIYPDLYLRMLPHQSDEGYMEFFPLALETTGYYEALLYEITGQKRVNGEKLKSINQFAYLTYSSLSDLGYHIIRKHDVKRLRSVVELLDRDLLDNVPFETEIEFYRLAGKTDTDEKTLAQIQEKYEDAFAFKTYRRHSTLGLKSWLLHLHRMGRIPEDTAVAMNDLLLLDYGSSREALRDIMNIRTGKFLWYFSWQGWLLPLENEADETEITDPHEWLSFGFFASQIIRFQLYLFPPERLLRADHAQLTLIIQAFERYKDEIAQNLPRWRPLLRFIDNADFESKAEAVINVFRLLAEKQERDDLKKIADEGLNEDLVCAFRTNALKAWKREAHLWDLLSAGGLVSAATENDQLQFIGRKGFEPQFKRFFLEHDPHANSNILTPVVGDAGRQTDTILIANILQQCPEFRQGKTVDLIVESLEQLRKSGHKPDGILLSSTRAFTEDEMLDDARFQKSSQSEPEFEIGKFDGVPVYYTYSYRAQNHVIVFASKDAFRLAANLSPDFADNFLQLEVKELPDEEALRLGQEIANRKGAPSDAELIAVRLRTGINLTVGVDLAFYIDDVDSVRVGLIVNG